jgi:uncharacterized protein (TIGR03067 family)
VHRLSAIALLLLGSALPAAPVPKELKEPPDSERLQGVWVVVQGEAGARSYRWTFEGQKLFAGGTADAKGIEYGFVIRSGVTPRELDISRDGRAAYVGIYKFVGDELHIAYHSSARPPEFSGGVGGRHLHVLRRLAEAKK